MTVVREVMTRDLVTLPPSATAEEAARLMKQHNIGDVLVCESDQLRGIVTDRDLAIRCLADGGGADEPISEICSADLITVGPDDDVSRAVDVMRECAIRRVPVVDGNRVVGVVSLGDLAQARDPRSALGQISSAPPNQ